MKPAQDPGQLIRSSRKKLKLSQLEVSKLTGIHHSTLSRIETGERVPSSEQQPLLAKYLQMEPKELTAACADGVSNLFQSRRRKFSLPARKRVSRDRDSVMRYWRARTRYKFLLDGLNRRLSKREDRDEIRVYLREACFDSDLEYLAHLQLLSRGAVPGWASPQRSGFRAKPIVDPKSRECTGSDLYPALATSDSLLFPQVALLIDGRRVRRPDLLWLKRSGSLEVQVVEFDGAGHDHRQDEERDKELSLPVVRFCEEDVVSGSFLSEIWALPEAA